VRPTVNAVCTIGDAAGISPAGRSPTSSFTTVIIPGRDHRRFSSATASSTAARNRASSAASAAAFDERMSTSIQSS